jgi:Ni2+-binding GTPase involved in maturation of urease and hydrogenase
MCQERGKRVGLITNDQAANLVDTASLQVQGLRVEEVAGACFCCKFDELAEAAEKLRVEERPDVLLGEPVGSCTDLAATVVKPLQKFYGDRYRIAPYSVLVDPTRARQIVLDQNFGGFSPQVAYIFQKQLEEADLICLNKVDGLGAAQRADLVAALHAEFPRAAILCTSGLTGEGFAEWLERLENDDQPAGRHVAEVDYDIYAAGEAELGWLNATFRIRGEQTWPLDDVVRELVAAMATKVTAQGAEIAHVKVMIQGDGHAAVANCVGANAGVVLSKATGQRTRDGLATINARVHLDPSRLQEIVLDAVKLVLAPRNLRTRIERETHFRPGRPVPVHRFAAEGFAADGFAADG